MGHAEEVRRRQIEQAQEAGQRWQAALPRRAEAVRRLKRGGPEHADTPERVRAYRAREAAKKTVYAKAGIGDLRPLERRIGPTLDLDETPPNEAASRAGLPVGRIVELGDDGTVRDGFATGFLIAGDVMLTNHHVFAKASECRGCGIQFGYELRNGSLSAGTIFRLDPTVLFHASKDLDFAIVGIQPFATDGVADVSQFKTLTLSPTTGKVLVGQSISIIQYPEGGPKKYGVRDNELLLAPTDRDSYLQYTTDTLPGSSGSPAFNKDWEVVALHHSGVPEMQNGTIMTIAGTPWQRGMPDDDIHWVANEGVRISRICDYLRTASVSPTQRAALDKLLRTFGDDFENLPAVQSQVEGGDVVAPAPKPGRGVAITVNGTANFYFGVERAVGSQPALPAPPVDALAVEKKLRFDPDYPNRSGYDAAFLGIDVPLPGVSPGRASEILKKAGKMLVLAYHHYSLVMNKKRRLMMWSAVNVDYTKSKRRKKREQFGTDTWVPDPRIPAEDQIQDPELYEPAAKFDRGHIVRREDTAWGDTAKDEVFANSDSFHWTNCTPQHEQFNRAAFGFRGLWGELENHIQSQVKNVGPKMSLYAGPVLDDQADIDHDFGAGPVKIPRRFWKVLLVAQDADSNPTLRAYAFVLDQSDAIDEFGIEDFSAGKFDVDQVTLEDLSTDTGVTFDQSVLNADAMLGLPEEARKKRIESLEDVRI